MKNYMDMIPENFFFSPEEGVILAAKYDDGLESKIPHFSIDHPHYKRLMTVGEILKDINKNRMIVCLLPEFMDGEIGITRFSKDEDGKMIIKSSTSPTTKEMFSSMYNQLQASERYLKEKPAESDLLKVKQAYEKNVKESKAAFKAKVEKQKAEIIKTKKRKLSPETKLKIFWGVTGGIITIATAVMGIYESKQPHPQIIIYKTRKQKEEEEKVF